MIALALPWLLVLLLLLTLFFAYNKRWLLCLGCVFLILVGNIWGEVFAVNLRLFANKPDKNLPKLKILSWNVNGGELDSISNCKLFHIIDSLSPDIIFLSENYGQVNGLLDHKLASVKLKRADYPGDNGHWFYSRIPIKKVEVMTSKIDSLAFLVKCKAVFDGSDIVIYGVHLSSNNFNRDRGYVPTDSICTGWSVIDYLKRIRNASRLRVEEAEFICSDMQYEPAPVLVVGDMNDVSFSDCIRTLENAGLKDAWWSGGFGYGATMNQPLPYRIDHIMYSSPFCLHSIKVIDSYGLSDHNALYAELLIKEQNNHTNEIFNCSCAP